MRGLRFSQIAAVCMNLALVLSIKTDSLVFGVLGLGLILVPFDQVLATTLVLTMLSSSLLGQES